MNRRLTYGSVERYLYAKDVLPDEDTENWEVAYCEQERKKKSVGRGVYPENWKRVF